MPKFFFDKEARVEYECYADDDKEAMEYFQDALNLKEGIRITVDSYQPEREINHAYQED